ncbi:hypothetical protein HELRODRAFT_64541 [Helobdella robusta]|uniref:Uncharacterized protein n=1 Tax=Helobdella robusta TaxID=6412 RepID=T1FXW2_HELRO|nr:hypothetical protein HELRODRAFT_64541 [Helobdella robusta]ESO05953.1 hypothetical protein HELRODRAFT_64541 [Helobdella robusta]
MEFQFETFTSLRLSNINPRVPDEEVRETVYHCFKKFGEFNIKFAHTVDRRLVYVNFAHTEDAQAAKNAMSGRLELFDRLICIEPVNHNKQWNKPPFFRNDMFNINYVPPPKIPMDPLAVPPIEGPSVGAWEFQRRDARFPDAYFPLKPGEDQRQLIDMKHITPEEDKRATRTLFVANVDDQMAPETLKKFFDPFGIVEDIDIKCPVKGNGNPYAFIRFFNLDMAYAAKVELSGQFLGKYQCKIGYARPVPTTCVWIGGLTENVKKQDIIIQFERFGKIVAFQWPKDQSYAYVAYDNVESAQLAIMELRGFPVPGTLKGLKTDFAELKQMEGPQPKEKRSKKKHKHKKSRSRSASSNDEKRSRKTKHKRRKKVSRRSESEDSYSSDEKSKPSRKKKKRSVSTSSSSSESASSSSEPRNKMSSDKKRSAFQIGNIEAAETIIDLARCLPVLWSGPIELKNSTFYTHMHHVSGNGHLVDSLLNGLITSEHSALKINQRLRLDRSKLKEVERRINTSGDDGHCVLLAVSENSKDASKHRPLTNLVSYLKQKNAAGVLSLPSLTKQGQEAGLLHTFPPCEFAHGFLQRCAPKLTSLYNGNDYIVVILIKVSL